MADKKKIEFIKICGVTDPKTALECVKFNAHAIGLVFFKKSPRHLSDEQALAISEVLPNNIITTGVFVDKNFDFISDKIDKLSLKAVQLHGNESPDLISALRTKDVIIIKAVFAKKKPYFQDAYLYNQASYLLAECGKGILPGGNAETWNYTDIAQIKTDLPVILAGGLDPFNINNALNMVSVSGFDVSSGVESSPGIKDLNKVENFINQIKSFHQ
jgi:phosphoribosylanthranilate isomerase